MESLEDRRLLAGDSSVVQSLPFSLEFDTSRPGTILDKDGEGTGSGGGGSSVASSLLGTGSGRSSGPSKVGAG